MSIPQIHCLVIFNLQLLFILYKIYFVFSIVNTCAVYLEIIKNFHPDCMKNDLLSYSKNLPKTSLFTSDSNTNPFYFRLETFEYQSALKYNPKEQEKYENS